MNRMPQTPEEWRDYEADKLMHKVRQMRQELEKTHSLKNLVEMQIEWDRRLSEQPER